MTWTSTWIIHLIKILIQNEYSLVITACTEIKSDELEKNRPYYVSAFCSSSCFVICWLYTDSYNDLIDGIISFWTCKYNWNNKRKEKLLMKISMSTQRINVVFMLEKFEFLSIICEKWCSQTTDETCTPSKNWMTHLEIINAALFVPSFPLNAPKFKHKTFQTMQS